MATYYADLSLSSGGGDGLSPSTPWDSPTFFIQSALKGASDIVNVKGSATPDIPQIIIKTNLIPWGEVYRINYLNHNGIYIEGVYVKGAILKGSIALKEASLESSLCIIDYLFQCISSGGPSPASNYIKGCAIIGIESGYFQDDQCGSKLIITDTIIDCDITSFDNTDSDRCCYTAASVPGLGTHTNKQVSWVPPTWPAWDAPLSSFDKSLLNYGTINRNSGYPQYGNPPYTGYEYDLSLNARDDIGAYASENVTTTTLGPTTTVAPTTSAPTTAAPTTTAGPTTTADPGTGKRKILKKVKKIHDNSKGLPA